MTNEYARRTYDNATLLKAAGLVAASAAGSLILDLGDALMDCDLVVDVTAIEVASNDEIYTIQMEGSNVAGMGSASVTLPGGMVVGNNPAPSDADIAGLGRYISGFRNEVNGTTYRYVRIFTTVAGTIATGVNFSAFLAKRR